MLAATLFRPPPASGPFARDFEAYYAAGAAWDRGLDPWSRAIWNIERTLPGVDGAHDELLPFVGPAAALPLFGLLAHEPQPVAVRIWTALLAGALLTLILASLSLARARGLRTWCAGLLLVAAAAPATSGLALGQAALLAAGGIAGALLALERRAFLAATVALLCSAVQPNLALALLARLRDRRALVAAVLAAALFAAVTFVAGGGARGVGDYARVLSEHGGAERFDAIQFTPAAIAWSFGAAAQSASAVGAFAALFALAAVVAVTLRARLNARDGTLLALAALPFAVPFFHEHDFVVELIPLTILAVVAHGHARAAAGIAAGLILVDWLTLAQRVPAQPEIVFQGLAAAFAFAALGAGSRLRRADLAAPITLLVAAALAVPLARAFPAPTWPDALPPGYRAPPAATAAEVWADEQRASGLLAQTPAWGVLRSIPLAGCIVLGVAVVASRRRAFATRREARPSA